MTDCGSVSAPSRHFTPSAAPASLQPAGTLSPALVPPTHHVFPSAVFPNIHLFSPVLHSSLSLILSLSLPFSLYSFCSESAESASQHTPMSNEGEICVMNSGQSSVCVLQLCVYLIVAKLLCRIYVNLDKLFYDLFMYCVTPS